MSARGKHQGAEGNLTDDRQLCGLMSLPGLPGSVSCGLQLLSTFLPQLDLGCPGRGGAERGRVVEQETVWGAGGRWCGHGVLFSQACFIYVLCQMWLIRGK